MSRQARIKKEELPEDWSPEAADFINKVIFMSNYQILQRKPINRLGIRGAAEIKEHPWFQSYPWKELYQKKIKAGYIPKVLLN